MAKPNKRKKKFKHKCPACGYAWESTQEIVKACCYCKRYFKIPELEKRAE